MTKAHLGCIGAFLTFAMLSLWLALTASVPGRAQDKAAEKPAPPRVGVIIRPGMPGAPAPADDDGGEFTDRVTLPTDHKTDRKLEEARRLVKEEDWQQAIKLLQSILDVKEDVFMRRQQDEKGRRVSVRAEANRIIGSMPKEGLQFYELQYGAQAKVELDKGKKQGNPQAYADVALRYMHTEAGAEAAALLGTYHLDHGRYIVAALCYERLLDREGALDKLPPITLFKATLAFHRAGNTKKVDRVWTRFAARFNAGQLPPALRRMSLPQLKELAARKLDGPDPRGRFDWPMFMGSPDRSAQSEGGAPFLVARYHNEIARQQKTKEYLKRAIETQATIAKSPALSAFHPIAAGGKLVYRSYWGIHAVNPKTGKWDDGGWEYATDGSIDNLADHPNFGAQMPGGMSMEQTLLTIPSLIYANSLLGTLSTDNIRVYFIEDIALPPPTDPMVMWRRGGGMPVSQEWSRWTQNNKLVARDLRTGKLVWEIGTDHDGDDFADTFFLGPPLTLGDKLYALAEVNAEVRLLCLDPRTLEAAARKQEPFKGTVVWSQTLCVAQRKLTEDPGRRPHAALLAYGDGILICPTNAGAVLGVDLLTRSLVWAHSYHEKSQAPRGDGAFAPGMMLQPGMAGRRRGGVVYATPPTAGSSWSAAAPVVRDGKVLFTAPDGVSVHCLNLADGALVWAQPQGGDLYLAGVYRGKVLLVGKDACRALSLQDGKELWKVQTGTPSGRGIANDTTYFLPVSPLTKTDAAKGEVWAIDIDTGKVQAKSRSPRDEVAGNLVFYEGDVISQTTSAVLAYPQLAVKERDITLRLEKNPSDPVGLTERGELRLYRGDLPGATTDLRAALQHQPPDDVKRKARNQLYEALGEMIERNFAANETHLTEFEKLLSIDGAADESPETKAKREEEQLTRRANFLRLVAKGREQQGKLADALQAYVDFSGLTVKELLTLPDDPAIRVRPDVWAQGRIAAMFERAKDKPEQRKSLEAAFDDHLARAEKAEGGLEVLERAIKLFGQFSTRGRKARLQLAERLMEKERFKEAELHLHALRKVDDRQLAGQAVEALARLMTKMGLLEDAAYFYRALGKEFGNVTVRDGKTGQQILEELSTDKRFIPFLDEPRRSWHNGKEVGVEVRRNQMTANVRYALALEPEGEVLPFFQRHRVIVQQSAKFVDKLSGEERNSLPLAGASQAGAYNAFYRARPTYRLHGHLVVLPWGQHVHAYDPVKGKELWRVNRVPGFDPQAGMADGSMQIINDGRGNAVVIGAQEWTYSVGALGPVTSTCVCFVVKDEGLVAVDPLSGKRRWVRREARAGGEIFGDDDYLFLVPPDRNPSAYVRTMIRADGEQVPHEQPRSGGEKAIALRAADGTTVNVPDFVALYRRKLRVVGRNLLLRDIESDGVMALRLYDVATGKNVWTKQFPARSALLNSLDPSFTGAVDVEGHVTILDVASGKEVLRSVVDSAPMAGNTPEVHLVTDPSRYYVIFNQPPDPNRGVGMVQRQVWASPAGGLQSLKVNGPVHALDRANGKKRWQRDVAEQTLILEQFADFPLMVFGTMSHQMLAQNKRNYLVQTAVQVLHKEDGRVLHPSEPEDTGKYAGGQTPFFSYQADLRSGTIELSNDAYKVTITLDAKRARAAREAESAEKARLQGQANTRTQAEAQARRKVAENEARRKIAEQEQVRARRLPAMPEQKAPAVQRVPIKANNLPVQLQLELLRQLSEVQKEMQDLQKARKELDSSRPKPAEKK